MPTIKNGLLISPYDGIYSFTWTALTAPNSNFESHFYVNHRRIAGNRASAFRDKEWQSATKTVVVEMKKSDKASIKVYRSNGRYLCEHWSSYSGYRIF